MNRLLIKSHDNRFNPSVLTTAVTGIVVSHRAVFSVSLGDDPTNIHIKFVDQVDIRAHLIPPPVTVPSLNMRNCSFDPLPRLFKVLKTGSKVNSRALPMTAMKMIMGTRNKMPPILTMDREPRVNI